MSDGLNPVRVMCETALDDIVDEEKRNLIYIYDFFNMWTFLVELAEIAAPESGKTYPNLMFAHGVLPEDPPEKEFKSEDPNQNNEDFEGLDLDSFDDFNEQWN